jgi:Protein of unknown function (DUF2934)
MDTREDRIRKRAYEIWDAAGQTGAPEDHWLAAERELQAVQDQPEASFDEATASTSAPLGRAAQSTG